MASNAVSYGTQEDDLNGTVVPLFSSRGGNALFVQVPGDLVQGPPFTRPEFFHSLDDELLADMGYEFSVLDLPSVSGAGRGLGLSGDAVGRQSVVH